MVHRVRLLYVAGICELELFVHVLVLVSYLWCLLFIINNNILQLPCCLLACLCVFTLLVSFSRNTLCHTNMLHHYDQTKILLPLMKNIYIVGELFFQQIYGLLSYSIFTPTISGDPTTISSFFLKSSCVIC